MNAERDLVRARCTRTLSGHRPRSVRETLASIAASPFADLPPDLYGDGENIAALEAEVACLLGKEAAMFALKGVTAQQAALRTWSDRSGRRTVALHPRSHIAEDERDAFERLHPLHGVRVGPRHAPFLAADLERAAETIGTVVVELPLRRVGYRLPEWDELVAIAAWTRAHGARLHLDGARLWEAQPFYDRPLHEIAAVADSVYVSFYKGLGGLGGAVLAGPDAMIAEARVWHARHCGPLMTAFPFVVSARDGLAQRLPQMRDWWMRARDLARALQVVPGLAIVPGEPQTNAFQLLLPGSPERIDASHLRLARETGTWLFGRFAPTDLPDRAMAEVTIGEAASDLGNDEIVDLVARILVIV